MSTEAPSLTDTIALAHELFTLAEQFEDEAHRWADPECRAELLRAQQQLLSTGRRVIRRAVDDVQGAAFAHAARIILGNVQGARRFFTVLDTPPRVRRERA